MSVEELVYGALAGLASGRVYPDEAPDNVVAPYIVYQQVGGDAINYVEPAMPDLQNARIQIAVWASRRADASALALQVEQAMRLAAQLQTTVLGARRSVSDPIAKLRGSQQDYSIWVPNE
ncbi:DUF3168 domain-containing protein [Oxalobacteraceae bacterium A2-2]